MKENRISAPDLLALNPRELPGRARDFSRYSFWQYTRLSTADLILNTSCFRVSSLREMNDLDEARAHQQEEAQIYALCFCNSNTEKIPMWYLYSGLAGDGAALGLTPAKMLQFIRSIQTVRGVCGGQRKEEGDLLRVGAEVELRFGWVYYCKSRERDQVWYRNKWYTVEDADAFRQDNCFLKAYPWEYEREFRLVFRNRTDRDYNALFVDIPPQVQRDMKVMLAPELHEGKLAQGFACIGRTHTPRPSELSIRMNLFSRHRGGLLEYLREELARECPEIDAAAVCRAVQQARRCGYCADGADTE